MSTATNAIATRAEVYKKAGQSGGSNQLAIKSWITGLGISGLNISGSYVDNQCVKYSDITYTPTPTYVSLSIEANDAIWNETITRIKYDFTKSDGTHETGNTTYYIGENLTNDWIEKEVSFSGHGLSASTTIYQGTKEMLEPFYISCFEDGGSCACEYEILMPYASGNVYYQTGTTYDESYWVLWDNPTGNALTITYSQRIYLKAISGQTVAFSIQETTGNEHADLKVGGNIMSLQTSYDNGDRFGREHELYENNTFQNLFSECGYIQDAYDLILPAIELTEYCYDSMFYGCINLQFSPQKLPATNLAPYCYASMFTGCSNLITSPILPASETTNYCYSHMFNGCTSLKNITCLATIDEPSSFYYWVDGVDDVGTFICYDEFTDTIPSNFTQYRYENCITFNEGAYVELPSALYNTYNITIKQTIHFNHINGQISELFGTQGLVYTDKINVKIWDDDLYYIMAGSGGTTIVGGTMNGKYTWELVNGSSNSGSSLNYFAIDNEVLATGLTFGNYGSVATSYYLPGCNGYMYEQPVTLYDSVIRKSRDCNSIGIVRHHYVPVYSINDGEYGIVDTISGDFYNNIGSGYIDNTDPTV